MAFEPLCLSVGAPGKPGADGKAGLNGHNGTDGKDGKPGKPGLNGSTWSPTAVQPADVTTCAAATMKESTDYEVGCL